MGVAVAMMVVMGVPVGVAMVVGMSHRKMLYYNITGVHGPSAGFEWFTGQASPNGADFLIRRELAAGGFGQRSIKVRFFLKREHIKRLGGAMRSRLKGLFHDSLLTSAVDCTRKIRPRLPTP